MHFVISWPECVVTRAWYDASLCHLLVWLSYGCIVEKFLSVWNLYQRFNSKPLLPITSAQSSQIESALVNLHKQSITRLANQGRLQVLIIILPDFEGSYGKCLLCSN